MFRCSASRFAIAAVVVTLMNAPAAAQPKRAFPAETLRGTMVFGDYPNVTLNGHTMQLSPASRVRNQANLIVMAASLKGERDLVHYTLDMGGTQLRDVWVLRPEEAAVRPWPTTLEQARSWVFNPATQTWTKP